MEPKVTVLLCWWNGWRPLYQIEHVNALARQLRYYLKTPHRIALLTDQDSTGAEVDEVLPLPYEPSNVVARHGINCFRRLKFFDPSYTKQFGTDWVMSLDLDTLLVDDITGAVEWAMNDFGFCILKGRMGDVKGQRPYNGAIYTIKVGQHAHIWHEWDWVEGPRYCATHGWRGSDQVWLSLKLRGAPMLSREQGIYFLGEYLESSDDDPEPAMLNYSGPMKPWSKMSKRETPELYAEYQRWTG